jgi:hypothetical protein
MTVARVFAHELRHADIRSDHLPTKPAALARAAAASIAPAHRVE